jgi:hypothetical protein
MIIDRTFAGAVDRQINRSLRNFFLFGTYNTVSIILKRVSKRSSFRYASQEHLFQFLRLPVTHSELLLCDQSITVLHDTLNSNLQLLFVYLPALPTLIFAKYNFNSIMF